VSMTRQARRQETHPGHESQSSAADMCNQEKIDVSRAGTGPILDTTRRQSVHSLLLAWYACEGRHYLPWRHTRDPYAIAVAESMLQQTQVERVLSKYTAFLNRFPTVAALAEAPTSEVIRSWSGLGYNLRAIRLQELARQVMATYGGQLPDTLPELLQLRGVGRYTAGAIACFAYGLPVATVDTNIRRVLWRVFRGIPPERWPSGELAVRDLLALAEWALPLEEAYNWQQALMDLGATVCLSRRPLCSRCPVASCCLAYAETAQPTLFPEVMPTAVGPNIPIVRRVAEEPAAYTANAGRRRERPQQRSKEPFRQSSRYFRGRTVELLRGMGPDESLSFLELGQLLSADFAAENAEQVAWLDGIVRGLARDGLVRLLEEESTVHDQEAAVWRRLSITLP
jgi:A/G-specific adenine glycosylase